MQLIGIVDLHGPEVDQILADEVVTSLSAPGNVLWPLTDNLGTVRDVADFNESTSVAQVVNHLTYDCFGRITAETNAAVDFLFAYTGRERDEETGLYYYRARYYDPAVGRFLSQDPIGFEAHDPNLYRYVENGPTNFTDARGLNKGHHIVPQALWDGMSDAAQNVFDQVGARIWNRYYDFHDGLSMNGISHNPCYIDEVRKELKSFFGRRDLSKLTKTEAEAFINHLWTTPNETIQRFNRGVLAEAYAAKEMGEELYYKYLKEGKYRTTTEAYEAARKKTTEKMRAARKAMDELAEKGQKKAGRRIARRLAVGAIPAAGVVGSLCVSGDLNAAGREAFLDATGLDWPVFAGQFVADLYERHVEGEMERLRRANTFDTLDGSGRKINRHGIDIDVPGRP